MLCLNESCLVNPAGDRISGGSVFLVPYVEGATTCDINDAVDLYPSPTGGTPSKSLVTDQYGSAVYWLASGLYHECISHSGKSSIKAVQVSCDGTTTESSKIKTQHSMNGQLSYTFPFTGEFCGVEVTDATGKERYPRCQVVGNSVVVTYRDDCAPDNHTLTISTQFSSGTDSENTEEVCGYIDQAICEIPTIGTVSSTETQVVIPFSTASGLSGQVILSKISAAGTMNVNAPNVSSDTIRVPVDLTGGVQVGYNILVDTSSIPLSMSCGAPVSGELDIIGLSGSGEAQIAKSVGGTVTTENLNNPQGNVYVTNSANDSSFTDVADPHYFGGLASNLVGSTFTGIVQLLGASDQNMVLEVNTCYFAPALAQYDNSGAFVSAIDANGDSVAENEFARIL